MVVFLSVSFLKVELVLHSISSLLAPFQKGETGLVLATTRGTLHLFSGFSLVRIPVSD